MDGVIRHWDPDASAEAERAVGLPSGSLEAAAYGVPEYQAGVLGAVTFEDWCSATEGALASDYGPDAARSAVARWHARRGTIDPEMRSLIASLRREVRVGLLSNAHDVLRADLAHHRLDDAFEHVLVSAELGLAKPDPAIFVLAAETFGVPPDDCYFADDLAANVEAARATGMDAEQFITASGLVAALALHGIGIS